ncbi:hypothetical protein CFC21_016634 [Triticum aestivum]|uniref:RRM domain-containing protein n=3 Tax=Triticum TaxID=4564 RepID=A0A9R1R6D7_TRITD|nr:rRNA-processing protein UTP23 homolog [Triticum dicoccoides]XP_044456584.1 rRNA-processing protein UTP23 homolog [Triticum aestivum]KAF7000832.1 hypothetical protein CFC21_016634 [Triticum aestivum]VAH29853.1 unnamed protein product [Triticum turgidum subsp. durum]VAI13220.1 unnamed protein product [Triticum turgidum subsp. durum]
MFQYAVKQATRDLWDEAKVYVRNLPYDVSSERLVQLFEQDGVIEVTVSICGIGDRRCITRLGIFFRTSFENAKVVTAVDCIMSLVCDKNWEHYSFATQDSELREKLWEVPGVPVIYGLKNSLFIEQPFVQQSQFAQLDEKCNLLKNPNLRSYP